jgi:hypothetical protein
MSSALACAAEYGIAVCFADLGDWGESELRSEYDATVPEIRLNIRVAAKLAAHELGEFVALAVGHEIYHHRERIGEVQMLGDRAARELAASAFARVLLERPA